MADPDEVLDIRSSRAPVLVAADAALIDDVRRLAAAAGVEIVIVRGAAEALHRWTLASVVLVGAEVAAEVARLRPSRRTAVHVVARERVPDEAFRDALALGAEDVAVLPTSDGWLVEVLTDAADGGASRGLSVGVLGASGGVGASVLAAALASESARSGPSLLIDVDPLGAGADRLLGIESAPGVRWDSLAAATGRLSARSLREALPASGDLRVLGFAVRRPPSLPPFALREVVSAARRGFDLTVLDLPRTLDPALAEVVAQCDHLVLVTTATVVAATAASRLAASLPRGIATHLVVRGSDGVEPDEIGALLGIPVLHVMTDQRGLDEAVGLGLGPLRSRRGPLARATRECLAALRSERRAA